MHVACTISAVQGPWPAQRAAPASWCAAVCAARDAAGQDTWYVAATGGDGCSLKDSIVASAQRLPLVINHTLMFKVAWQGCMRHMGRSHTATAMVSDHGTVLLVCGVTLGLLTHTPREISAPASARALAMAQPKPCAQAYPVTWSMIHMIPA